MTHFLSSLPFQSLCSAALTIVLRASFADAYAYAIVAGYPAAKPYTSSIEHAGCRGKKEVDEGYKNIEQFAVVNWEGSYQANALAFYSSTNCVPGGVEVLVRLFDDPHAVQYIDLSSADIPDNLRSYRAIPLETAAREGSRYIAELLNMEEGTIYVPKVPWDPKKSGYCKGRVVIPDWSNRFDLSSGDPSSSEVYRDVLAVLRTTFAAMKNNPEAIRPLLGVLAEELAGDELKSLQRPVQEVAPQIVPEILGQNPAPECVIFSANQGVSNMAEDTTSIQEPEKGFELETTTLPLGIPKSPSVSDLEEQIEDFEPEIEKKLKTTTPEGSKGIGRPLKPKPSQDQTTQDTQNHEAVERARKKGPPVYSSQTADALEGIVAKYSLYRNLAREKAQRAAALKAKQDEQLQLQRTATVRELKPAEKAIIVLQGKEDEKATEQDAKEYKKSPQPRPSKPLIPQRSPSIQPVQPVQPVIANMKERYMQFLNYQLQQQMLFQAYNRGSENAYTPFVHVRPRPDSMARDDTDNAFKKLKAMTKPENLQRVADDPFIGTTPEINTQVSLSHESRRPENLNGQINGDKEWTSPAPINTARMPVITTDVQPPVVLQPVVKQSEVRNIPVHEQHSQSPANPDASKSRNPLFDFESAVYQPSRWFETDDPLLSSEGLADMSRALHHKDPSDWIDGFWESGKDHNSGDGTDFI
ncbi:hypothetical protein TWF694_003614 [Orbilia ellipsospora]|uniref:Uncharacterized protein n=1 Tax=Orbilia ellipsospora TaxID=2528407 RepID=A0AAV9WYM6_9PEZI